MLQGLPASASGASIARFWRVFTAEQLGRLAAFLPVVVCRTRCCSSAARRPPSLIAACGTVDLLLPGKGYNDAPLTMACRAGEPPVPLFHSVPRSADAVGGAEQLAGHLLHHELAVLRCSSPSCRAAAAAARALLRGGCCRTRACARRFARCSPSRRRTDVEERQPQPLVRTCSSEKQQGEKDAHESAETLLLRVKYNDTGFSGLSLPEIYV